MVALILILFRDGLEVEEEMLQRAWHLPFRKLVLGDADHVRRSSPLAAHTLTDLGWTESFLVGALLSPTDPVLSSTVVTNPRVPRLIRHSLNLESGLNDGLALPAVLAFTAAAESDGDFVWWQFVLQDVTVGVLTGLVVAFVAVAVDAARRDLDGDVAAHQKALYALGVAFAAYGPPTLPPEGNGFIAVFVCAIAFGIMRPDVRESLRGALRGPDRGGQARRVPRVRLDPHLRRAVPGRLGGAWASRCSRCSWRGRSRSSPRWPAPAASTRAAKAFMAWFGPKGVATMTFALFVLGSSVPEAERILNLAALTVFLSVIVARPDRPAGRGVDGRAEASRRRAA